jgi:hypothetical protein
VTVAAAVGVVTAMGVVTVVSVGQYVVSIS